MIIAPVNPVAKRVNFVAAACVNASTTITIPEHQAGDLIVIYAAKPTAPPDVPAAGGNVPTWTSIRDVTVGYSIRVYYAVATGSSTESGTWTGATRMGVAVLRGQNASAPIGYVGAGLQTSRIISGVPSGNGLTPTCQVLGIYTGVTGLTTNAFEGTDGIYQNWTLRASAGNNNFLVTWNLLNGSSTALAALNPLGTGTGNSVALSVVINPA